MFFNNVIKATIKPLQAIQINDQNNILGNFKLKKIILILNLKKQKLIEIRN